MNETVNPVREYGHAVGRAVVYSAVGYTVYKLLDLIFDRKRDDRIVVVLDADHPRGVRMGGA